MAGLLPFFILNLHAGFHVSQLDGNAVIHRASAEYALIVKAGQVLQKGDLLNSDFDSKVVLLDPGSTTLVLAPKTSLAWSGQAGRQTAFSLSAGGLKTLLQNRPGPLVLNLPHGATSTSTGLAWTSVTTRGQAWIDLESGELLCTHRNPKIQPVALKPGDFVLLDELGIHRMHRDPAEREKFYERFVLSRGLAVVAALADEATGGAGGKGGKGGKAGRDQEMKSETQKRQKLKDAHIEAGHGQGEGEYSYAKSSHLTAILLSALALLVLLGLGVWLWTRLRRRHPHPGEEEEDEEAEAHHEQHVHDEDITVWRGNLTSHDKTLKTEKVTHILGDVEYGASIEAAHKLVIRGSFQGATLKAADHVTVQGGINGQGKGVLEIRGSLKTSYINEASVRTGGDIDADQGIRNSRVCANGEIRVMKKTIMGGTVACNRTITCQTLGSDFCNTEVILGLGADKVWQDTFKLPLQQELEPQEDNAQAVLCVYNELVSTLINMGNIKLDQHKPIPGPIMACRDPAQPDKLQLRGFRKDEAPVPDTSTHAPEG